MNGSAPAAGAAPAAATTYPKSRHDKSEGTIMLNATHLMFFPSSGTKVTVSWADIAKHQVSPASHPKCLLKLVPVVGSATAASAGPKGLTFGLSNRPELERIRKDVTGRLAVSRKSGVMATSGHPARGTAVAGKKRPFSEAHGGDGPASPSPVSGDGKRPMHPSFTDLDPDALAVTRSSLLSSNPTLRAQHRLLVAETQTLTEEDFWSTHTQSLADEYARISGKVKAGQSSAMRANLDLGPRGRVRLGVEEMRQIFVLYPAVHRAYEEKVPLELSEEQFWRKYLESEYFHRDRGRIGSHVGRVNKMELKEKEKMDKATGGGGGVDDKGDDDQDEAGARMAAAGTNDIFSRLEAEMNGAASAGGPATGKGGKSSASGHSKLNGRKKFGNRLAVGQFDLAATAETERGSRLLTATDLHPPPPDNTVAGRVVDKYNRHWAMVLNPDDATAGSDLLSVARSSVNRVLEGDDDAKVGGGVDRETTRLVGYANAHEDDADHVKGIGGDDGDDEGGGGGAFMSLDLRNVGAYTGELIGGGAASTSTDDAGARRQEERRRAVFSRAMADGAKKMARGENGEKNGSGMRTAASFEHSLPNARLGQELLKALTNKMAADARTEADAARVAASLPEDFRARLNRYFRRSSELLRHFFALRDLVESSPGGGAGGKEEYERKMARIVKGMESVYREMEAMRKELPQTEQGEIMRKMCLPVMDQLDWAFKLHRDGSGGGGGGGGFVTVDGWEEL
uniref:BSD domain-containing protein n=1 Tax=Odontella aurita TaxID=265563 RepID=A0A7S4JKW9_9STRA|mmetsp:Transcript_48174/g.145541  ORF Transcript_48174/g.145541 Transcript_48174/m.145541 type:complete len:740 (+) Transcript_48174:221-2440(+)